MNTAASVDALAHLQHHHVVDPETVTTIPVHEDGQLQPRDAGCYVTFILFIVRLTAFHLL